MSEQPLEDVPDLADLVHQVREGEVIYLTEHGERTVAIVPARVAARVAAELAAEEDAADIEAARASLAEPGENVPLGDVLRELGV